jgi:hypothetical protein
LWHKRLRQTMTSMVCVTAVNGGQTPAMKLTV